MHTSPALSRRCFYWQSHRARFLPIAKSDGKTDDLRRRIAEINPGAGIIECIHHPLYLEDVFTGNRIGLDFFRSQEAMARPTTCAAGLLKSILARESLNAYITRSISKMFLLAIASGSISSDRKKRWQDRRPAPPDC